MGECQGKTQRTMARHTNTHEHLLSPFRSNTHACAHLFTRRKPLSPLEHVHHFVPFSCGGHVREPQFTHQTPRNTHSSPDFLSFTHIVSRPATPNSRTSYMLKNQ